jgi:hypothetical protein
MGQAALNGESGRVVADSWPESCASGEQGCGSDSAEVTRDVPQFQQNTCRTIHRIKHIRLSLHARADVHKGVSGSLMAGEPHSILLVTDASILVVERKVLVGGLLHLASNQGSGSQLGRQK